MENVASLVLKDALKYIQNAYGFIFEKGYAVDSLQEAPMGWQVDLRKRDFVVRIVSTRGEDTLYFRLNTLSFGEFMYIGEIVYASTGEVIDPRSFIGYSQLLQKHIDKIESYFESEYVTNKDSLQVAQKEYHETLTREEEISAKEPQTRPILYYPLKVIIMLLLFGALTTLYAVLLERLSSAFSLDLGSYGILMLAVSVLLAIGTMLSIRRKMG